MTWKFSNPADAYPVWDPPHGDYYAKPSQPQYTSYRRETLKDIERRIALKAESLDHHMASPYFFWLGAQAWGVR